MKVIISIRFIALVHDQTQRFPLLPTVGPDLCHPVTTARQKSETPMRPVDTGDPIL